MGDESGLRVGFGLLVFGVEGVWLGEGVCVLTVGLDNDADPEFGLTSISGDEGESGEVVSLEDRFIS
jgi:hypothetical protein